MISSPLTSSSQHPHSQAVPTWEHCWDGAAELEVILSMRCCCWSSYGTQCCYYMIEEQKGNGDLSCPSDGGK